MNVVILGAGTVGRSIARLLCEHQHNVRLVDSSRAVLDEVDDSLDVQTLCGSASDAVTLFQAGVLGADLCLAVTSHDEFNIVGASMAKAMGSRRTVARIYNASYRDFSTFDYQRHFHIDRMLSLQQLTALELARYIRRQGLFAIENFAQGGVEVQEISVDSHAKSIGKPLKELKLPKGVRIGLLSSAERTIIPSAEDIVAADDHVTLIGKRGDLNEVAKMFESKPPDRLNIVIAGGGQVGYHLAKHLEHRRCNVLLMETNQERCNELAEKLESTTILHADVTRRSEMEEARVGSADVFVASTGRDEDNIICGVEARELGSQQILSVIRRPDYVNVLEKLGIDIAVSPRDVMARQVLGMLQQGPIVSNSPVAGGVAEVWEVDIRQGAPITEAKLKDMTLQQCLIAAIVREDYVTVPGGEDQLQPGDTAVVLVHKSYISATLKLFERA